VADAEMLAMHILHLTVDRPFAQKLVAAAKQKALGLDYHVMAVKVLEVYKEVLNEQ
jgi:hypothetical protein